MMPHYVILSFQIKAPIIVVCKLKNITVIKLLYNYTIPVPVFPFQNLLNHETLEVHKFWYIYWKTYSIRLQFRIQNANEEYLNEISFTRRARSERGRVE